MVATDLADFERQLNNAAGPSWPYRRFRPIFVTRGFFVTGALVLRGLGSGPPGTPWEVKTTLLFRFLTTMLPLLMRT